jgi:hypothetical protein
MTHIAIQEQLNGKAVETVFDSRGVIIGYADQ